MTGVDRTAAKRLVVVVTFAAAVPAGQEHNVWMAAGASGGSVTVGDEQQRMLFRPITTATGPVIDLSQFNSRIQV